MSLSDRMARIGECMIRGIARHLPFRIRYWVVINAGARYIESDEEVHSVPLMTVVRRMAR